MIQKNIYHLQQSDCASSKCSSGWYIWVWYFSLAPQVP